MSWILLLSIWSIVNFCVGMYMLLQLKGEFGVVPTDKISGQSLSSKIPVDINSIFMKLYVTWPMWPKGSHISGIWFFEVNFVVSKLMKNIIFNKTESFGGRNTSNYACQIFCSKSNCETVYHSYLSPRCWFLILEIYDSLTWSVI
jgi:hypothetical protein